MLAGRRQLLLDEVTCHLEAPSGRRSCKQRSFKNYSTELYSTCRRVIFFLHIALKAKTNYEEWKTLASGYPSATTGVRIVTN